ncbi:hypothetical protein VKS41_007204 [Umbelopsis sp. WA50703]
MNHRSNRIQLDPQESWTKALWPRCNCCFRRKGAIRLDDDDAESPRHAHARMFLFDQHQRDMEFESLLSDEEDQNLAGNINLFLGDDDEWLETDAELVPVDRINKLLQPNQELSTMRRDTDSEPQQGSQEFPQPYIIKDLPQNPPSAAVASNIADGPATLAGSIVDSLSVHSDQQNELLLNDSPSVDTFSPRPGPLSNNNGQQEDDVMVENDFVLDQNEDLLNSVSEQEEQLIDRPKGADDNDGGETVKDVDKDIIASAEDDVVHDVEEGISTHASDEVEESMRADVAQTEDFEVDVTKDTAEVSPLNTIKSFDLQPAANGNTSSSKSDIAPELSQEVSALAIPPTPEPPLAAFPKQAPMTLAKEAPGTPPPQDPQPSYNAGRRSSVAQVAQTYLGDKLEDLTEKLTFIKKNIIMSLEEDEEDEEDEDQQAQDRSVLSKSPRPQHLTKEPPVSQRPARHSSLSRTSTIERREREREPEYMQTPRPSRPSTERFNSFQEEASTSISRIFSKITSNDRASFSPSSFFAALSGNDEEPSEPSSEERPVPVRTSSRGAIDPQPRSDIRNAEQRTQSLRRQSIRRANAPPNFFEEEPSEQLNDEVPFDFGKVLEMGRTFGKSFGEDVMQNGLKMFNDVSDRMKNARRRGSEENWLGKDNWL